MGRIIFKLKNSNEIEILDSDYEEQDFKIMSVDSDSTTIRLSTVEEDLDVIEDIE
tara:strand:+ start:592 stop:756 length:165 start_codon:yes stop_codon:yes gene_type:complete